jgi:hypothetical protein
MMEAVALSEKLDYSADTTHLMLREDFIAFI